MTNLDSECDPFSVIKSIQALVIKEITQVENEKKIIPFDYDRMLKTIVQMEEKGLSAEQAQIEAFYANTRK